MDIESITYPTLLLAYLVTLCMLVLGSLTSISREGICGQLECHPRSAEKSVRWVPSRYQLCFVGRGVTLTTYIWVQYKLLIVIFNFQLRKKAGTFFFFHSLAKILRFYWDRDGFVVVSGSAHDFTEEPPCIWICCIRCTLNLSNVFSLVVVELDRRVSAQVSSSPNDHALKLWARPLRW